MVGNGGGDPRGVRGRPAVDARRQCGSRDQPFLQQGPAKNLGATPDEPVDAEYANGAFWITTRGGQAAPFTVGDRLVRIDPTTFDQSTPLILPGPGSGAPGLRGKQLAAVGDVLWVVNPDGSVEFITSPDSSPTVRREPGYAAEALAVGDIGVWALGERIDPPAHAAAGTSGASMGRRPRRRHPCRSRRRAPWDSPSAAVPCGWPTQSTDASIESGRIPSTAP